MSEPLTPDELAEIRHAADLMEWAGSTVDAQTIRRLLATMDLDAAWAEAEAALPEGWHLCEMTLHCHAGNGDGERGPWLVEAHDGDRWWSECGEGPTPAAALRALTAALDETRRERA